MQLPIDLKYYTLRKGWSTITKDTDQSNALYLLVNKDTGIVEFEALNLPKLFEIAISMDINMEQAAQFHAQNFMAKHYGHLDVLKEEKEQEEDPLEGFILPGEKKLLVPGGGGSAAH